MKHKTSKFFRRTLGLLTAACTTAVLLAAPAQAETATRFEDNSRLVAIGGSVTEIVYALGGEKLLIARDQTSTFPQQANALKDVGYLRRLAPEGVLSVNPSGILMIEGSGPKETLDVLSKASVPIITVPESYSRDGILKKIEVIGAALGLQDKASQLADATAKDLDAAAQQIGTHKTPKRVLFVLSAPGGRLMVAGTGTAADSIIKLAGAVNVIDAFAGYKQLTDEAAEQAAPDVILTMGNGQPSASEDQLLGNAAIRLTPAAKNKAIIRMDGAFLLGFGPRTGAAIRELSERLYGASKSE